MISSAVIAAALTASPCAVAPDAQVIVQSRTAIVWKETEPDEDSTTYGCLRSRGKRVELGWVLGFEGSSVHRVRLAGPHVAFVSTTGSGREGYGTNAISVRRVDLSGRSPDARISLARGYPVSPLAVTGLALNRYGAFAWRLTTTGQHLDTPDRDRGRHDAIGAVDRRGARLAAIAPEGTLSAFKLNGRTLSWRGPQGPKRATLSGNASPSCQNSGCWP